MNRRQPSFFRQKRGMVVLGAGGVLLLATGWIAYSRLGPSPAAEAFAPARRIDENALVAANAERAGETAAPPAASANAVEAASDDKAPPVAATPPIGDDKPSDAPSDAESMIDEADAAIEQAVEEAEAAAERARQELEGEEGGKPDR